MARIMIIFFTAFLFLSIFPFKLTMAQGPGAPPTSPTSPAPAPPASPAPPAPGTPTTGTTSAPGTPTTGAKSPVCDVNDYTPGVSVPLNQIKFKTSGGADVKISGTVSYLDGCTFLVSGFTYFYAAASSYWFGSNVTDPNAFRFLVSPLQLGQYQSQNINFTLKFDVSFNHFNVLNIYSMVEDAVYAQAVLKTPPTPTPSEEPSTNIPKSNDATRLTMDQNMMNKIIFGAFVALFHFI